jgi:methylmalonyl-CoA mutase
MASVIGGANAISILPEDEKNLTMTRAARNISNLLREESHFDKVVDASAGSYAIDTMVDEFAQQAWELFQERQVK